MPHMGDRVSGVPGPPVPPTTAPSPYLVVERDRWSALRAGTPLTLDAADLERLRGLGEPIDLGEVEEVYLPLARLISLLVAAAQERYRAVSTFLGEQPAPDSGRVPFVLGVAGSVAVGKSTTSRILQALLRRWPAHPHVEHFKFLKAHCKVTPKMTIPAPSTLHFRQGRQSISRKVYPELDAYFDDVALAYQKAIRAFYDAGCRYLQLDDTAWSMICDPKQREDSRKRGDDPDSLPRHYTRMTNKALEAKPADMTITMHSCRGNFRSTFIASGGYEFVAEELFGKVNIDGYFLEFDTERAGGFDVLRHLTGNKQVVLGLVTSKSGRLEPRDDIKRRIDEATKYVPLDQLCLSPQCGFASTEEGNVLAEEEQWAKLRMIVELADEVWGK